MRHWATAIVGLLSLIFVAGCGAWTETPCDPIGKRTSVITAQEYKACAGEMMAALDALKPQVSKVVQGDASMRPQALERTSHLQLLLTRSAFSRDMWSAGRQVERWPDSRLRDFNSAVFQATHSYKAALESGKNVPASYNWEYLEKGWKHHDEARTAYHEVW